MKIECGLIRNQDNNIIFETPSIDKKCDQGCIILTFGCFYITLLRNEHALVLKKQAYIEKLEKENEELKAIIHKIKTAL